MKMCIKFTYKMNMPPDAFFGYINTQHTNITNDFYFREFGTFYALFTLSFSTKIDNKITFFDTFSKQ